MKSCGLFAILNTMSDFLIHVLVVNINRLKYTLPLLDNLDAQTHPFALTVVDQASTQRGTKEALIRGEVIFNKENRPLNYIWNEHAESSSSPYLCFLNNDIKIPKNFIADTVQVLETDKTVGAVIHITNNKAFSESDTLKYEILPSGYMQGWDFTIRKEAFVPIPADLKMFAGDDWLFGHLQLAGWKVAIVFSSPIIHHNACSRKFYTGNRHEEREAFLKYGLPRLRSPHCSKRWP